MRKSFLLSVTCLFLNLLSLCGQDFSKQDSLRGSITAERVWWDLQHYKLDIKVDDDNKFISGSNTITYKVLDEFQLMQIDLQEPLAITKIIQNNTSLRFEREGNAYFIYLIDSQIIGETNSIEIYYEGKPFESLNPPWSGGFTWQKDNNKNAFIATSCQGIGASIWWPCKDHMYDEPDMGADIIVTPPKGLMDVSNGRLKEIIENKDGSKTYHWEVVNPINNYGINVNIGTYDHFSEVYKGENGNLTCDYYVLPYNLEKAKIQFKQVPKMLEAFEHWFGPYPFYEDGYKLVEVPYLGMEHQSSVTYGNHYKNGYLGRDLSNTGFGLKFDFIIVHESGHEWFANNITYKDAADMWIHEGFTAYSETLYLDYHFGKEAGNSYLIGTRYNIQNDKPIIGQYDVNNEGSFDMYYKGSNMIHLLRQILDDDEKFRELLRGVNKEFYHQTVTSKQIEAYISQYFEFDINPVFDQYLRTTDIPTLQYRINKKKLEYRFKDIVEGFNIPLKVYINKSEKIIFASDQWTTLKYDKKITDFKIDPNYYIKHDKKK